jgi:hypothetical protein
MGMFSYDWSGFTGACNTKDPARGLDQQHYCCPASGLTPSKPDVCASAKYVFIRSASLLWTLLWRCLSPHELVFRGGECEYWGMLCFNVIRVDINALVFLCVFQVLEGSDGRGTVGRGCQRHVPHRGQLHHHHDGQLVDVRSVQGARCFM